VIASVLAAVVILVAVPLNWYGVWQLWQLVRDEPEIIVLRERAFIGTALALNVTIFGLIFLNNGMAEPLLDLKATQVITRLTLLVLSTIPALYWLWLFRNGNHP
jgi:hypothetical protein